MTLMEQLDEWEQSLPREMTSDVLWCSSAYRFATFLADSMWEDLSRLSTDPRTAPMADQLGRAIRSIGANYAEAYSRSSGRDRSRMFEYSLGSAREARDWCFKARHVLGADRTAELIGLLTRITQLLTVTVVRERDRELKPKPSRRTSGRK